MQYVTAWGALIDQAKLTADDFVIVSAASSSVGIAAIQVGRSVGASVIASTRTNAKAQALTDAGAHHVIATAEGDLAARVKEITGGKGARAVFDPIGGPAIAQFAEDMLWAAFYWNMALSARTRDRSRSLRCWKSLTLTIKGYLYTEIVSKDDALARAKAFVTEGLESGKLDPLVSRTFPFDQIQEATRFLESNEQIGKIIVTV